MLKSVFPVVILGSTGAGKSKLALELAVKYGGEILSTDSMQVYKELDIVTNKVTHEEMKQVPHHLIDFLDPLKSGYNVSSFKNAALPLIDRLIKEKKLPVIVGGTNYYIEALLWDLLIEPAKPSTSDGCSEGPASKRQCVTSSPDHKIQSGDKTPDQTSSDKTRERYKDCTSVELHGILKQMDPEAAVRYHPHDRRKILRAIEVCEDHGVPISELYSGQHSQTGASAISGPLRYPGTCVIWVQCDQEVLDKRTDKRVDKMIEQGLIAELQDFHERYNQERLREKKEADYTKGIFQSIGFKEFHDYLILPTSERESEQGETLLNKGIDDMKRVTRKYARKQKQWMTNRFIRRQNAPAVYAVNSTDASLWETHVFSPAAKILEARLEGREPEQKPIPHEERDDEPCYHVCDVCDGRVFVRTSIWQEHLKGRRHKKALERKHRLAKIDASLSEIRKQKTKTENLCAAQIKTGTNSSKSIDNSSEILSSVNESDGIEKT